MLALSFCLRDSALRPCTFGTRSGRDSPEFLHVQSPKILGASTDILFEAIIHTNAVNRKHKFMISSHFVGMHKKTAKIPEEFGK